MERWNLNKILLLSVLFSVVLVSGCVERKLTINTEPQGAVVVLNDEEIGLSPVTVSFNWYGDYNVMISKEGYETLKTHRELKGPYYDSFPFDFFAGPANPKMIEDSYTWDFKLSEKKPVNSEQLIKDANNLKGQLK